MDIEVAFQMTKERFKPVGRFGYPRIIDVTKHIRQAFLMTIKERLTIFMFVSIAGAVGIKAFSLMKSLCCAFRRKRLTIQ